MSRVRSSRAKLVQHHLAGHVGKVQVQQDQVGPVLARQLQPQPPLQRRDQVDLRPVVAGSSPPGPGWRGCPPRTGWSARAAPPAPAAARPRGRAPGRGAGSPSGGAPPRRCSPRPRCSPRAAARPSASTSRCESASPSPRPLDAGPLRAQPREGDEQLPQPVRRESPARCRGRRWPGARLPSAPATGRARSSTVPPARLYLMALERRFSITCMSRCWSART